MKKKTKKESQKKRETIFQDTEKMENKCKKMSNKKKETDKTEYFGNRRKQKKEFRRSLQGYKKCQESIGYRKQRDNQRTRKKQILKGRKRVREPRKH